MSKAGSSLNTSSSTTANNNSIRVGIAVQADWDNKQFSNALSLHVRRLFEFILQFESTTRSKLAKLNEKLTLLERQLEFLEAQVNSVNGVSATERDD